MTAPVEQPEPAEKSRTGFWSVMDREIRRIATQPIYLLLLIVLPLVGGFLLWAIFQAQAANDLPVVVFDGDQTQLSRKLVRMIDSTSAVRVSEQVTQPSDGYERLATAKAYVLTIIPRNFADDLKMGRAVQVVAYYNAQWILPSSLIIKDIRAAVATMSAGAELQLRQKKGASRQGALASLEPIRIQAHALFNPFLNYVHFFVTALWPTLLQMFVVMATVNAIGLELKHGTAREWLDRAGGAQWKALLGKLLPYTVHYCLLGLFMLAAIFKLLDVPQQAPLPPLAAGTCLFVLAGQAMGVFIIALTMNLRMGLSGVAFFTGSAFAFVGMSFPFMGMPALAKAYSLFLPLTHYLRLLIKLNMHGAPLAAIRPDLSWLAGLLFFGLAGSIMLRRAFTDPKLWGRQ